MGRESRETVELPHSGFEGLRFIDSHLHLADYDDSGQPLAFAAASRGLLVTAGTGAKNSARGAALSKQHPTLVRSFVGVHPSEAGKEGSPSWLEDMLPAAAGLGEIGLDPKYSEVASGSAQMKLLRFQLGFAEKAGKPVQVHSRGAERECLDVLGTYKLKAVLLHWFQGEETLGEANGLGYYASFGPALLISKKLKRMAKVWGRDRVLVESDGPVGFAALGGAGGPWLVPSVVFELSRLLGSPFEEAADAIVENSLSFLG